MKKFIPILLIVLSGCAIPLKITIHSNKDDIARQELYRKESLARAKEQRIEQERKDIAKAKELKIEAERKAVYKKIIDRHTKRLKRKIAEKEKLQAEAALERNKVLKLFDKEQQRILTVFERTGMDVFTVGKWLNEYNEADLSEYKSEGMDRFFDYIYDTRAAFRYINRWSLDKGFKGASGFFSEVKSAHKLLLKMEEGK